MQETYLTITNHSTYLCAPNRAIYRRWV